MPPPMIAGLYPYTRGGVISPPRFTLAEIPASLAANPSYREDLLVLAGDATSARQLEAFGLHVHRTFDDAPPAVHADAAHKMKHWMCLWALREYGEFLWVDWDTVMLRRPDDLFWAWCREGETPKFIHIQGYWAGVNCGIYYACRSWAQRMAESFEAVVSEPNDELLWASILPPDLDSRPEFWWGRRVVQVWRREDFAQVGSDTYFAHVKQIDWASDLRAAAREETPATSG